MPTNRPRISDIRVDTTSADHIDISFTITREESMIDEFLRNFNRGPRNPRNLMADNFFQEDV